MLTGAVLHAQIDALQVNDAGGFVGYGEEQGEDVYIVAQ